MRHGTFQPCWSPPLAVKVKKLRKSLVVSLMGDQPQDTETNLPMPWGPLRLRSTERRNGEFTLWRVMNQEFSLYPPNKGFFPGWGGGHGGWGIFKFPSKSRIEEAKCWKIRNRATACQVLFTYCIKQCSNLCPIIGTIQKMTGWWFQIFFFHPYLGKIPIGLIFFRWVETTN